MSIRLSLIITSLAAFALPGAASAEVVLTIDISNPSAVVFTATGAHAQNNADDQVNINGVTLLSFFDILTPRFNSNEQVWMAPGSTLTPADVSPAGAFNFKMATNYVDPGAASGTDLMLAFTDPDQENPAAPQIYAFSTGLQALHGSVTGNFSGLSIPSAGDSGNIVTSFMSILGDANVVIGQWQVIPEPSVPALAVMVGMGFLRRRRSKA